MTGQPWLRQVLQNAGKDWPWYLMGACALWLLYSSGLLTTWTQSEEYGHGAMVVAALGYLLFKRRHAFVPLQPGPAPAVLLVSLAAGALAVSGEVSGINLLSNYGLLAFAIAGVWAVGGLRLVLKLLAPLGIVLLLFPLPQPLGPMVTAELQLVSSKLGVWFIRAMGGSVYLEGNVLDMGTKKLLVAEACAGLRYLFPLMSLGGIIGYFIQAALWVRWSIFLLAIPITVFMNSFRIAVTGMLVEAGGADHTEGFLHFFEGWVVFIVATLMLLAAGWVLVRVQSRQMRFADALFAGMSGGPAPAVPQGDSSVAPGHRGRVLPLAGAMTVAALATAFLYYRAPAKPERQLLDDIPTALTGWDVRRDRLAANIEQVAGASEYFYADFINPAGERVNVYVSYYETQKQGQIPHSPKVCLPGGGWSIDRNDLVEVDGPGGKKITVNRLVTSLGSHRMVAYYWLKQGSRVYQREGLARLDLIRYSLFENRTDGALIRLISEVRSGETAETVDRRLAAMARDLNQSIARYVPD